MAKAAREAAWPKLYLPHQHTVTAAHRARHSSTWQQLPADAAGGDADAPVAVTHGRTAAYGVGALPPGSPRALAVLQHVRCHLTECRLSQCQLS